MTQHDHGRPLELSPEDQRLLDALVECDFDPRALEALTPQDQRRADVLMSLFELLEDYPVEDADETLVHATLARIDRTEDKRRTRMRLDASDDAPRRHIRMPDFISVAAVILIGTAIAWPVTSHLRQRSIDSGCANNLRRMALAFGQYSKNYGGAMPVHQAGLFPRWTASSHNTINLDPLLEGGYCDPGHLSCPGHRGTTGGYSYQWVVPGHQPRWGVVKNNGSLVLGDRNPLIDAARAGRWVDAMTISLSHNGRGQNVLMMDGGTLWLEQPVIGANDYIWLPRGIFVLRGKVEPKDPHDTFLTH